MVISIDSKKDLIKLTLFHDLKNKKQKSLNILEIEEKSILILGIKMNNMHKIQRAQLAINFLHSKGNIFPVDGSRFWLAKFSRNENTEAENE